MEKNKLKILAIDDNKDNLISVKALIGEAFPDSITLTATNGKIGIELAESEDPHVILLDVVMPGMDGFEVCQKLKSNPGTRDIPVIFLTALKGDKESRIRALEVGAEAFLAKPIDETELTAQIRAMQKIKDGSVLKKAEKETLSEMVAKRTRDLELAYTSTMNLLEDLKNENETRRKSEEALRESEEKHRTILETAMDGFWLLDMQGGLLEVNETYCKMSGYSEKELLSMHIPDLEDKEAPSDTASHIQKIIEQGQDRFESRHRRKDGSVFDVEVSVQYRAENGGHFVAFVQDITERKLVEEKNSSYVTRLSLSMSAANMAWWEMDISTGQVVFDQRKTDMLGYSSEEFHHYEDFMALVHPGDHDKAMNAMKAHLAGAVEKYEVEYRILTKSGEYKWFYDIGAIEKRDSQGAPLTVAGIVMNITGRKQAEELLKESAERLHEAQKLAHIGVWSWKPEPDTVTWSEELYHIAGLDPQLPAPTYKEQSNIYTPESWKLLNTGVEKAMETGESYQLELELIRPNGESRYVNAFGGAKFDSKGQVIGLFGTVQDNTESKQAEKKLIESEIDLEKRNNFISTILENLVTGIAVNFIDSGLTEYINPAYSRVYGWPAEDMKDIESFFKRIYPDPVYSAQQMKKVMEDINSGDPERMHWVDLRITTKTGEERFVEARNILLPDQNLIISTAWDITESKRAEEALAKSHALLTNLARLVPGVIYQYRLYPDGRSAFPYSSPGMNDIYEVTPEDVQEDATPVFGRLHPEDYDYVANAIQESARTLQEFYCEYRVVLPRQGLRWRWSQAHPERLADGSTLWHGIISDITESKLAEEELRGTKALLETVVENIPLMIFLKEAKDLRFVLFNRAGEELLGYDRQVLLGKNNLDLFPPEQADNFMIKDREVLDGEAGMLDIPEEPIQTAGKGQRLLHTRKVSIRGADGISKYLLGISEDITERKKAEEEIQSRNKDLSGLYTLSRQLVDAEVIDNVIDLVTSHAVKSLDITSACIALLEKDNLVIRGINSVRGLEKGIAVGDRQPISALPNVKLVLEKNEPVILQSSNSQVSSSERAFLMLDPAQSTCLVALRVGNPIQFENPVLGVLILGEDREEKIAPFISGKVEMAVGIADQAASAIRRMLAIEQANHRLQRIASLREIDTAIAKTFDLRLSLEVILRHVIEQLGVDAADILVVNTSLQKLELIAGRGFRTQAMERIQQRLGEGQAGKAVVERRMVQIQDVAANAAVFTQPELLKKEQISAYIAVPLIIKGQVNGVLEIFQRTPLEPDDEWFDFLNTLAGQTAIAIDNDRLFIGLQRSNLELGLAYDATIEGWSHALDLRDKETEGHTLRVTEMTLKLAQSFNLSNDVLKQVRWGALLHDIGKMGVPDGILLKPGSLTEDEWIVMKKHPVFAYEMLMPIHYLKDALDIPYCHHEKWDGSGYPRGLIGEQIPLAARIFAVVDVWDALISDRPYRKAWTKEKALEHIKAESGKHFDPRVVDAFLSLHSGL